MRKELATVILILTIVNVIGNVFAGPLPGDSLSLLLWRGEHRKALKVSLASKTVTNGYPIEWENTLSNQNDIFTTAAEDFLFSKMADVQNALPQPDEIPLERCIALGLALFRCGKKGEAKRYLEVNVGGKGSILPVIDVYRRLFLSELYIESGEYKKATEIIESLFTGEQISISPIFLRCLPVSKKICTLYIEASSLAGARDIHKVGERLISICNQCPSVVLKLAWDYFCIGEIDKSRELFLSIDKLIEEQDIKIYIQLFEGLYSRKRSLDENELYRVANILIRNGLYNEARKVLKIISKDFHRSYRLSLLWANLFFYSGELRKAELRYRRIFRSQAPVDIKRDALYALSSLYNREKEYKKSAYYFRKFAMYYPDDARALTALSLSARLYLREGMISKARGSFYEILNRSEGGRVYKDAIKTLSSLQILYRGDNRIYRYLKDYINSPDGIDDPAIYYWSYRVSPDLKEREKIRSTLIRRFPLSLYTYFASKKRGEGTELNTVDIGVDINLYDLERIEMQKFLELVSRKMDGTNLDDMRIRAVRILVMSGFIKEGAELAKVFIDAYRSDDSFLFSIYFYTRAIGMIDVSLRAISELYYRGKAPGSRLLLYPIAFTDYVEGCAKRWNLPATLILSVMREESAFDRYAESNAGALGLMQLMPSTALWVSDMLGLRMIDSAELKYPEVSINLGSFYLSRLAKKDRWSIVSVLASYNAGRGRMKRWIHKYKPWKNSMCAVEAIGPLETRNFVRRVIGSLFAYLNLYGLYRDGI